MAQIERPLEFPPSGDVVERISELLTPGSSLIVSDYGISEETGKDTDFIVVTQ
jgi:hypothetical protein